MDEDLTAEEIETESAMPPEAAAGLAAEIQSSLTKPCIPCLIGRLVLLVAATSLLIAIVVQERRKAAHRG